MPRYECPKCNKVFCGWCVKYKYKNKCPVCGGELRRTSDNKESRKGEGGLKANLKFHVIGYQVNDLRYLWDS